MSFLCVVRLTFETGIQSGTNRTSQVGLISANILKIMESAARKLGLQINQEKTKYMIVERKNTLRQ